MEPTSPRLLMESAGASDPPAIAPSSSMSTPSRCSNILQRHPHISLETMLPSFLELSPPCLPSPPTTDCVGGPWGNLENDVPGSNLLCSQHSLPWASLLSGNAVEPLELHTPSPEQIHQHLLTQNSQHHHQHVPDQTEDPPGSSSIGIRGLSVQELVSAIHSSSLSEVQAAAAELGVRAASGQEARESIAESGTLIRLIALLGPNIHPSVTLEVAGVICNLASGTDSNRQALLDAGVIPLLRALVTSSGPGTTQRCATALGNIAFGSRENQRLLVEEGCLEPLAQLLKNSDPHTLFFACLAISNVLEGQDPTVSRAAVQTGLLPPLASLTRPPFKDKRLAAMASTALMGVAHSSEIEAVSTALLQQKLATPLQLAEVEVTDRYTASLIANISQIYAKIPAETLIEAGIFHFLANQLVEAFQFAHRQTHAAGVEALLQSLSACMAAICAHSMGQPHLLESFCQVAVAKGISHFLVASLLKETKLAGVPLSPLKVSSVSAKHNSTRLSKALVAVASKPSLILALARNQEELENVAAGIALLACALGKSMVSMCLYSGRALSDDRVLRPPSEVAPVVQIILTTKLYWSALAESLMQPGWLGASAREVVSGFFVKHGPQPAPGSLWDTSNTTGASRIHSRTVKLKQQSGLGNAAVGSTPAMDDPAGNQSSTVRSKRQRDGGSVPLHHDEVSQKEHTNPSADAGLPEIQVIVGSLRFQVPADTLRKVSGKLAQMLQPDKLQQTERPTITLVAASKIPEGKLSDMFKASLEFVNTGRVQNICCSDADALDHHHLDALELWQFAEGIGMPALLDYCQFFMVRSITAGLHGTGDEWQSASFLRRGMIVASLRVTESRSTLLDACSWVLLRYAGHPVVCGLLESISSNRNDKLRECCLVGFGRLITQVAHDIVLPSTQKTNKRACRSSDDNGAL